MKSKHSPASATQHGRSFTEDAKRTAQRYRDAGYDVVMTRNARETRAAMENIARSGRNVISVNRYGEKLGAMPAMGGGKSGAKRIREYYTARQVGTVASGASAGASTGGAYRLDPIDLPAYRNPFEGERPVSVFNPYGVSTEGGVPYEEAEFNPNMVTSPIRGWERSPHSVDAEMFEASYGDIAQEIGGAVNFVRDVGHNYRRGYFHDRLGSLWSHETLGRRDPLGISGLQAENPHPHGSPWGH